MLATRFIIALLLLIMAGCATQIRSTSDLADQVDQQLNEHRYGDALRSVEEFAAREPNTEHLGRLREHAVATAARYESEAIVAANERVAGGDWHAAQVIYRKARFNFPESSALSAAEKDFTARRDAFIEHLRIVQYAEKASYLSAEIAQLEQISAATPFNLHTRRELAQQKTQRQLIATALLNAGESQLAAKNYVAARRYLTLSNDLVATTASLDALRQVPLLVKRQPIKFRPKTKPVAVRMAASTLITRPDSNVDIDFELTQIMAAYHAAREQGDLIMAQRKLKQALSLRPHSGKLATEQNALTAAVQQHVHEKLENGKYLYSMGEVDAAIAAWQIATALAPDDQSLLQRLERAQKFRQRYEELKK